MTSTILIASLVGILLGAAATYIVMRSSSTIQQNETAALKERVLNREEQLNDARALLEKSEQEHNQNEERLSNLREELSTLKERIRNDEERLKEFQQLQERFAETFKALSSDALKSNNQSFLELAQQSLQKFQEGAKSDLEKRQNAIDQLVKPIQENLQKVDANISELEKNRISAFSALDQHLRSLNNSQQSLITQTSDLVKALRTPNVRGRWGEIQLKRVVEIAGMVEYCDFVQQESLSADDDNKKIRPDMTIRLPAGKQVVVDSKAPLQGYLDAIEAKDEQSKLMGLVAHARHIRNHITQLSQKKYWDSLEESPEFVVLFLPGENFFSAALEQDAQLIEFGVEQKVIVATPTTLIALLRAISYGWRQEQLAENAKEISTLGKDLYERIVTFTNYFADIKKGLDRSIESYNKAAASLESRVLVSARRFKELGSSSDDEIKPAEEIERIPRTLSIAEHG